MMRRGPVITASSSSRRRCTAATTFYSSYSVLSLLCCCCSVSGGAVFAQECNDALYHECQGALSVDLNVNITQPWHRPTEYRYQVEREFESGIDQTLGVCRAFRKFKVCMGSNYASCISPSYFIQATVNVDDAYVFSSFFNEMHFVCGAGLQIQLHNEDCMKATWQNEAADLRACRYSFERKSHESPIDACFLGNQMLSCFENVFSRGCGQANQAAMFWGCEYSRVQIFTRFPACPLKCSTPISGNIIG